MFDPYKNLSYLKRICPQTFLSVFGRAVCTRKAINHDKTFFVFLEHPLFSSFLSCFRFLLPIFHQLFESHRKHQPIAPGEKAENTINYGRRQ